MSDMKNHRLCKLIRLSSDTATNAQSSANFTCNLGIQAFTDRLTGVALKTVIFPNCFYNIRAGINDTFAMREHNQQKITFTIPEGFYDVNTIMSTLQTNINASLNGGTVTVTQNSVNFKIVITVSGQTIEFFNYADGTTMANEIGFLTSSTTYVASYTADVMPSLQGLTEVFLVSDQVAQGHMIDCNENLNIRSVIAQIPITAPFGGTNIYEAKDEGLNIIYYPQKTKLQSVNVRLEDRQGNLVNLQNHNLKVVLKAYYSAIN